MIRCVLICLACLHCSGVNAVEVGFVELFNGKDLEGWTRVNTDESTWIVEDGMLICSGKPTGELRTTRMYQNFVLEVEWRHMKPRGNAGIFVWADDITSRGVPFHRSIEVQVLENAYGNTRGYTTHGDIFPIHGAKMTPENGRGGSRAFPTENRSKPSPEWNHYRIDCRDGEVSLAVNGKVVTRGRDCSPRKGYICIESEGGVVHYRNLRLKELSNTPVDSEHIAIANRGYRCLYTGVTLDGWSPQGDWQSADWRLQFKSKVAGSLTSKEEFGNVGFLFDFKCADATAVLVADIGGASLELNTQQLELKTNQWHRVEGEVRDGHILFTVNGESNSQAMPRQENAGPIVFHCKTPTEFANIYVRDLK